MPTVLEQTMPHYQFNECHSRWIAAEPDRVWQVLSTLTLDQLTLTRPLVTLRHLSRHPTPSKSLFTDGPVRMLQITAPTYAVGGAVTRAWQFNPAARDVSSLEQFIGFDEPGWVKYLTDFHVQPVDGGVQLSTETRCVSTDERARRRFAPYWVLIRPGSGLIRRDVLSTIARLSEAPSR